MVCTFYNVNLLVFTDQQLGMWFENLTSSHHENHLQMFIDMVMLSPNYSQEPCLKTWGSGQGGEAEDGVEAMHSAFCPEVPAILAFSPFLREPTTFTSVFKLLELSLWHATVAS